MYLKALGIHVYFVIIKDSYCINGKHLEANTKAIHTLKSTLNDDYLFRVSNVESDFCSLEHHHLPWRKGSILCRERFGRWV